MINIIEQLKSKLTPTDPSAAWEWVGTIIQTQAVSASARIAMKTAISFYIGKNHYIVPIRVLFDITNEGNIVFYKLSTPYDCKSKIVRERCKTKAAELFPLLVKTGKPI